MSGTQAAKQKPGSTPKGQQRPFAFENLLPPFQPGNFEVQILSPDFQPLEGLEIEAATNEATFEGKTNQEGIVKLAKPETGQITLLVGSSSQDENGDEATDE